jgi:predicted RNA polymerase sigma factor
LHSLYLLFNEGYNSCHTDHVIRQDLCLEAMRLCLLLVQNKITNTPKANALLALMCFQASREESRISSDGSIILLKDQDRRRWHQPLIEKGKYFLEQAAQGEDFSEYHIEAAIAGCHLKAQTFQETDWEQIFQLYAALAQLKPSPVVELNKAIALGYASSPTDGLAALKKITALQDHYLLHAAIGDFQFTLRNFEEARKCYTKAIALTHSHAEKKLLAQKVLTCG